MEALSLVTRAHERNAASGEKAEIFWEKKTFSFKFLPRATASAYHT